MGIPKKIHYCWFGNGSLPENVKECIDTWKLHMPDYELVVWNEESFDIESNRFVLEAYKAKKYAYVSDYVRLYALQQQGGIYFDTDVEVLKSFDDLLDNKAFIGYEGNKLLGTGIIGSEKKHPWIEKLLSEYDHKDFILKDGSYNTTLNSVLISKTMVTEFAWQETNTYQALDNGLYVYPADYFSAKDCHTGQLFNNKKTYSIHHFG